MTYIVSAYASEAFRGVIDNTQATAEAAETAALEWLAATGDKALTALVSENGQAVATYGWDDGEKVWVKVS